MSTPLEREFATPVYDGDDLCAAYNADELASHLHALARLNMAPATNARAIAEHAADVAVLLAALTAHAAGTLNTGPTALDYIRTAEARRRAGNYAESAVQL